MKLASALIFTLFLGNVYANEFKSQRDRAEDLQEELSINWIDFESAVESNKKEKKPFFIDMYTDWCGFCRKMDGTTFRDTEVVDFINSNFHPVKFNPEKTDAIAYRGNLYEKKAYGKRSYNELAVNLLAGKMSFPTFVILSKKEVKLGAIPGYHSPRDLIAKTKAIAKIK